jgi:hypothetical protein
VDDRLNGDGAGIALGVNDPVLGAHLLGVFTAIWALYYIANSSDGFLQARWRPARISARAAHALTGGAPPCHARSRAARTTTAVCPCKRRALSTAWRTPQPPALPRTGLACGA